jgi:hypothetical protein
VRNLKKQLEKIHCTLNIVIMINGVLARLGSSQCRPCAVAPPVRREAGVRNLKKQLEKIYRKAALKLVQMGVELPPQQGQQAAQQAAQQQVRPHL